MIEDVVLRASLSGLFGGVVAIFVCLLIEKFGGKIGGILGSSPSTIIPTAIGFALQYRNDNVSFSQALFTFPLGLMINACFLSIWRFLPPHLPDWTLYKKLGLMIFVSISFWFVCAVAVVFIKSAIPRNLVTIYSVGLVSFAFFAMGAISLVWFLPLPAPAGKNTVTPFTLLLRGLAAALAVFVAVMLTAVNDIAAGIAASFPAIFCTTMVSLWVSQGSAVPVGAIGPLILGSLSLPIFSCLFPVLVIVLKPVIRNYYGNIALSCFISWLAAMVGGSIPGFILLEFRSRWTEEKIPLEDEIPLGETTRLIKKN